MLMVRRANMGASIAGGGGNRKGRRRGRPDSLAMGPGRIASHGLALADIPRHHAAGPDHRTVADGDAGQDDGPAADPDIAADAHWPSKFQSLASRLRVPGMVGGIDLHR